MQSADYRILNQIVLPLPSLRGQCKQANRSAVQAKRSVISVTQSCLPSTLDDRNNPICTFRIPLVFCIYPQCILHTICSLQSAFCTSWPFFFVFFWQIPQLIWLPSPLFRTAWTLQKKLFLRKLVGKSLKRFPSWPRMPTNFCLTIGTTKFSSPLAG